MKGVLCSAGALFGNGVYFGDDSGKIDQVQNQHQLHLTGLGLSASCSSKSCFIRFTMHCFTIHLELMSSWRALRHGVALCASTEDTSWQERNVPPPECLAAQYCDIDEEYNKSSLLHQSLYPGNSNPRSNHPFSCHAHRTTFGLPLRASLNDWFSYACLKWHTGLILASSKCVQSMAIKLTPGPPPGTLATSSMHWSVPARCRATL